MLSSKEVVVGSIRDSGTRKLSTAPCPPRCRTSDNLVAFIRCPFYPESGQIADISGGLLWQSRGWARYLGPCGNAPFPIPARRTGRADLRHPALRLASS